MKKIIFFLLFALMTGVAYSQQSNSQTITIQTNGSCEHCKKVMMENVPQMKGVEQCSYDLKTAKLTVTYNVQRTNAQELREGISKLGYDADNVKADAEARAKLPSCCTQANKGQGCGGHGSAGGCGGCGHHH